jgi:glycosyltransferase involved in cell wall biosynthesis
VSVPPTTVVLVDPFSDGHHLGYASTIAEGLVRQAINVVFVVWAMPRDGSPPLLPGVRVVEVSSEAGADRVDPLRQLVRSVRCWRRAAHEAAAGNGVVHWLYTDRQELALALAIRATGPPAVATLFWPYFSSGQPPGSVVKRAYHRLNVAALAWLLRGGRLSSLAVQTERSKRLVVGALGGDLADAVVVIPDPSISPALPPRQVARDELGIPEDQTLLLFFGTMRSDKGPDLFLEALSRIRSAEGWRAIFAGADGVLTDAVLASRVQSLGLEERVTWSIGFVPNDLMARYFAAADVVVLPYRSTFLGTSGILQTSAAASVPVLATDVGDVGPAVSEYGLGVLVRPDSVEELERGLRDVLSRTDALAVACRDGGRRYAEEHAPALLVERMVEMYTRSSEMRASAGAVRDSDA